ncbi:MAG: glycosyltransferase family 2 protein [Candidatus Saccharimonadales bacterium]
MPRFSIVIPAYNEEAYLADTLQSLKKQTFRGEVEVIVVDNNSTDATAQVAKQAGAKLVSEKNVGVCWARQAGTQAAKGQIIVSTDADTTFDKDWLANIDDVFTANPDIVAIAGRCKFVDPPYWARVYPAILFGSVNFIYQLTGKTIYGSATNIAFRKSSWDSYDTSLTQGGDELHLIHNLQTKGKVAFYNDNPTYTSSRRLTRGFFYNFVVSFLIYYILEYNLSRLFKRPVIGACPTFRTNSFHQSPFVIRLKSHLPATKTLIK